MSNVVDKKINRRRVLKGLGVSSAAVAGSGVVSAESPSEYEEVLNTTEGRQNVLESEAKDLLEELTDRGIIQSATAGEFELGPDYEQEKVNTDENHDGWTVMTYPSKEGIQVDHLKVSKASNEFNINVHVRPQKTGRYAVVTSSEGERFVIDPSKDESKLVSQDSDGGFTTSSIDCTYDCCCEGDCGWWSTTMKHLDGYPASDGGLGCVYYVDSTACGCEECGNHQGAHCCESSCPPIEG